MTTQELKKRFEKLSKLIVLASLTQKNKNCTSMTERYYSIQKEHNRVRSLINELPVEKSDYTPYKSPVIISHNTTTWTKFDKKQTLEIINNILKRPKR